VTIDRRLLAEYEALEKEMARRSASKDPLSYSPHKPTGKQREFLALNNLEALYGGAAGGGKSDALLMAALQYVHVPQYAALILRRTYADLALPGAIMDRAKDWLIGKAVKWHDTDKKFTFPSGATLSFGFLDTERDKYRYQGAELQFIGFDELTQFPEAWYRYLLSRLRRLKGSEVPLRARGATNPGGIGHEWVKRRFIEGDGQRVFIPASLDDNPHLDADEYRNALAQLDASTRKQLLEGLWVRDAGGLVYQYDDQRNGIDEAPALTHHVLGIDYGYTDATAFTVVGWRDNDPSVYVLESYKLQKTTPSMAALEAEALTKRYDFNRIVGDVGGLGKGYAEEARTRFSLPIEPADKVNKRGYQSLFNGELERGHIKVVRSRCQELIAEWMELPWSPDRSKESEGFDNHNADSALYSWRACPNYHERVPIEQPPKTAAQIAEAEAAAWREAEMAKAADRAAGIDSANSYFDD
jgi:hypothetical protein